MLTFTGKHKSYKMRWIQHIDAACSPYYDESHRKLRNYVREFVDKEIMQFCHEWDEAKAIPKELFEKAAKAGLLASMVEDVDPKYLPYGYPTGIEPSQWDTFHGLIVVDELSRCGSGGVSLYPCCHNFFLLTINP